MPIEDLAQKIFTQNPTSKSASQNFRIPRARHIFQTGQQLDALKIIIQSNRVDAKVRELAKHILQEESQRKDEAEDIYQERLFINELNEEMVYLQMESSPIPQYDNAPRNPKGDKILISTHYQRDRKTSENALRMAQYLCKVNNNHFVFRRKDGIVNYTEPHHLVPLSARRISQMLIWIENKILFLYAVIATINFIMDLISADCFVLCMKREKSY